MQKWECTVCGYIYDPAEGDMENGVAPGTPFEELPDEWVCPVCGTGKDLFEQVMACFYMVQVATKRKKPLKNKELLSFFVGG